MKQLLFTSALLFFSITSYSQQKIYVTSKKDKRYVAYMDSLHIHSSSLKDLEYKKKRLWAAKTYGEFLRITKELGYQKPDAIDLNEMTQASGSKEKLYEQPARIYNSSVRKASIVMIYRARFGSITETVYEQLYPKPVLHVIYRPLIQLIETRKDSILTIQYVTIGKGTERLDSNKTKLVHTTIIRKQ